MQTLGSENMCPQSNVKQRQLISYYFVVNNMHGKRTWYTIYIEFGQQKGTDITTTILIHLI